MRPNIIFTKLNAELFQFLAEPLPYKTSRFDAFRYLYECQTDDFDVLLKYYINVSFDTTYKQLAIEWGWERKVVILKKLEMIQHKLGLPIVQLFLSGSLIPPKVQFGGSDGCKASKL